MKTAVSLPDELFWKADATAKKLRISRSKLYATAISEYLSRQRSASVTERLNAYYSRHPAKIDGGLEKAQLESLDKKW
jgi:metal-responsive CopG/Arc/MetJ family transcriptional regulator